MIGGRAYPISTDFRTGIAYAAAAEDGTLTAERFYRLWFPEEKPEPLEAALDAVGQFYRMGEEAQEPSGPIPYSFRQDSAVIYADFRRHYGIDLAREELHWWQFRALLEGLITHSFRQRVGYRTADLAGRSAGERAEILKYRRRYAVGDGGEDLNSHLTALRELSRTQKQEAT